MLSSTLDLIDNLPVGKHPLVIKLMKGCYNSNPPQPKYSSTWELDDVFSFMKTQGDNCNLQLDVLSKKLATLLAIASWMRTSELASISKESIAITSTNVSFSLVTPRKTQSSGPLKTFSFSRFPDKQICLVDCLGIYLMLSDYLRGPHNSGKLFVGLKAPNNPVSGNSIGRWIKSYLTAAGIDTSVFSAHSTRSAAASNAQSKGVAIDSILKHGDWKRTSTFSRFYDRSRHLL